MNLDLSVNLFVLLAVLAAMIMALVRAFRGPGRYNRILAINVFGAKTILLVALAGFLFGPPGSLDIAILYALMNFIAIVAVLRLTHYRELIGEQDAALAEDLDPDEPVDPSPSGVSTQEEGRS